MTDLFSLAGKRAFITGGTSGIGRAVAEAFVARDATVVIADITDGTAVANEISAHFVSVDVSNEASVEESAARGSRALWRQLRHRGAQCRCRRRRANLREDRAGAYREGNKDQSLGRPIRTQTRAGAYERRRFDHLDLVDGGVHQCTWRRRLLGRQARCNEYDRDVGTRIGTSKYPRKLCLSRVHGHSFRQWRRGSEALRSIHRSWSCRNG